MSSFAEQLAALRWKKFPVLNDGFVCLVDVMGDDSAVVQAARVSYGEGTRRVSDDRTLIRYLLRHRHTTPFEMVELKFLIRVPMDCWRQWIRHRTASVNEYSTRYSIAIDAMQQTLPGEWRIQDDKNRQGSSGWLPEDLGQKLTEEEHHFQLQARNLYQQRLEAGVAREQARKDLPLATYTEAYWKIDLHNLLHFLALRMDSHAQREIRLYSQTIGEQILQPLYPVVWEAFQDYRVQSLQLTRLEIEAVRNMTSQSAGQSPPWSEEFFLQCQPAAWKELTRSRERDECRDKLQQLGLLTAAK